jgi:hypothetical protein
MPHVRRGHCVNAPVLAMNACFIRLPDGACTRQFQNLASLTPHCTDKWQLTCLSVHNQTGRGLADIHKSPQEPQVHLVAWIGLLQHHVRGPDFGTIRQDRAHHTYDRIGLTIHTTGSARAAAHLALVGCQQRGQRLGFVAALHECTYWIETDQHLWQGAGLAGLAPTGTQPQKIKMLSKLGCHIASLQRLLLCSVLLLCSAVLML